MVSKYRRHNDQYYLGISEQIKNCVKLKIECKSNLQKGLSGERE